MMRPIPHWAAVPHKKVNKLTVFSFTDIGRSNSTVGVDRLTEIPVPIRLPKILYTASRWQFLAQFLPQYSDVQSGFSKMSSYYANISFN
jgi:hypothetical protein